MGEFDAHQVQMAQYGYLQATMRSGTDSWESTLATFEAANPGVDTATIRQRLAATRAGLNSTRADLTTLIEDFTAIESEGGNITGERLGVPVTLHSHTVTAASTTQVIPGITPGFHAAFHRPTVTRDGGSNSDPYISQPWYYPLTIQTTHGAPAGTPTTGNVVWSGGDRSNFHIVEDGDWYALNHTGGSAVYENFTVESENMDWKAVIVRGSSPDVVEFRYGHISGGQDCFYTDDGFSGYLVDPLLYRCYIHGPVYPDFGDPHTDATQAESATLRMVETLAIGPLNDQNACLQGWGTIDGCILVGGAFFAHSSQVTISNSLLVYDSTLYETDQGTTAPWTNGGGNTWVTMAELANMMDDPTVIRGRRAGGGHWHLSAGGIVTEGLPS